MAQEATTRVCLPKDSNNKLWGKKCKKKLKVLENEEKELDSEGSQHLKERNGMLPPFIALSLRVGYS